MSRNVCPTCGGAGDLAAMYRCSSCEGSGVHVTPGPTHVYAERPDGVRWCYGCRAHLPHTWQLLGDPPDVVSPYDPEPVTTCTRCGRDRTAFPGTA